MKKLAFKSIRTRLSFWFLFIALTPLLVALVITYTQRVKAIESRTFNKLGAIRDLKVEQLENWIDDKSLHLKTVAGELGGDYLENIFIKNNLNQNDMNILEIMRRLLDRFLKYYEGFYEISLINSRTGVIAISTNPNSDGMDKSDNIYFTEPMRTGELYIKDHCCPIKKYKSLVTH